MKFSDSVFTALRAFAVVASSLLCGVSALSAAHHEHAEAFPLRLEKGATIAIVGNALSDRMQHAGYLETLIHAHHPDHELVFRNLSASGDEVKTWHRSDDFGSREDWLGRVGADVVFAFYGFNESTRGEAGLNDFKKSLATFIEDTKSRNYSGRGSPQVVLFSPVANERHQDRNFPDPVENNRNIATYTQAMKEVAGAHGVAFVDLLEPSRQLFRNAAARGESLTINGVHLTDEAYRLLAPKVFEALFATRVPSRNLRRLRQAVLDKNWQWHQRYRTIDSYNIHGGRSALAYMPGEKGFIYDRNPPEPRVSNYEVMQKELGQRDVMTANRDRRVWAVAGGGDLQVVDDNLPPVPEVPTNHPGPEPDGSHPILDGEEAIGKMEVYPGVKVNLFADEKMFPELINPVEIAWDTQGRLWAAVWPEYPGRKPTSQTGDSLLVFEDTDGDGRADKMTTFATDLNAPTGFQFYKDGILVLQAPDFWYLRDTTGDGKADTKERVLMGLDSADSHHSANSIVYDPGGALYLSDGVFHRSQVETFHGPVRNRDGAIYRFEPTTGLFETYISYGFANPHGRVFDRWGNGLITDATGNHTIFDAPASGRLDYEYGKHARMRSFWDRPARPAAGTNLLTSRHFPEELQGNFLNLNVIGFQGIYNVNVRDEGSGLKGETEQHLLRSDDPNFIPSDIKIGPDGALYFSDWHNPIVGHMQHHLRDPNRDNRHGRIYRVSYEGRPLLEQPPIHGASIPDLLDLLREHEDHVRQLAKIELANHDSGRVVAEVQNWIKSLDTTDPDYEHHMMEALWVHQWHNVVNADLLDRMLASGDHRARAAAGRVLCYWRDRIPGSLGRFMDLARDPHPRVRLEAVRAASFYREPEAAEVALAVLAKPMDYYLEYALTETLRQLEPHWRKVLLEGQPMAADNPAALARLMSSFSTEELSRLPQNETVLATTLARSDATNNARLLALSGLARARGTDPVTELLSILEEVDGATADSIARMLPMQSSAQLRGSRETLGQFALGYKSPAVRESAWAAAVTADGSYDYVWREAQQADVLPELVAAIPQLSSPRLRNEAYESVRMLLEESARTQPSEPKDAAAHARYVRIELPRQGTLTLAEVEVFSQGENIALRRAASQSSTASGGIASRAVDGNTDGAYGNGGQTHTGENEENPWWELDLGEERPVNSIVVWNRTDGSLGQRLDGFSLTLLDRGRTEVFSETGISAPDEKVRLEVGPVDPASRLRRAGILALVSMSQDREATFKTLANLIVGGRDSALAARSLRMLPREAWSTAEAGEAAQALVKWAKQVPASNRTSREYVETIQVATDLADSLPVDAAARLQRDLSELRVAVFVIRAVPEQMRFDTRRIVVEAGKPFEVTFENPDFMPHNFVIVRPGTRQTIGSLADRMSPDRRDSEGRTYVPSRPEVIAATHLLEMDESETLQITAPTEEGVYEFVCTFPGHWGVMWGEIIVTNDVDAYLANDARPDAPAAPAAATHGGH